MSWSFSAIGKPDKIIAALEAQSGKETGQSKIEFDAALPHLVGLVRENFHNGDGRLPPTITIRAGGSGYAAGGEQVQRSCSVVIEATHTTLLV